MNEQTIIAIAVVVGVLIVGALIYFTMRRRQTDHLRDRFGDEYDRTVEHTGKRGDAEANLIEREKRVDALDLRPLTASEHEQYRGEWQETKALFVDSPLEAVLKGDRLLGKMMETRGFPMGDFDRRYEDLTVDHGTAARNYREGHDIALKKGDATTEEMRRALNNFEKLFDEMVRDAETGDIDHDQHRTTTSEARAVDLDGDGDVDAVTRESDRHPVK